MVKKADVQIGQSDVMPPRWYHYGIISVLLHGIMLTLCNYWIPDSPVVELRPQSNSIVYAMPVIEALYEGNDESSPEAVSANDNPFEEPDQSLELRPLLNLNFPRNEAEPRVEPELLQENVPVQAVLNDFVESQDAIDPGIVENNVNPVPEYNSAEIASSGAEARVRHAMAFGSVQNDGGLHNTGTATTGTGNVAGGVPVLDESALWDVYKKKLNAHFKSHRHYPEMARRLKLTGTVIVAVELSRNGDVLSVHVEQSSGIDILDEAALASAKDAAPVPAFPEQTEAITQRVLIPYRYSIN